MKQSDLQIMQYELNEEIKLNVKVMYLPEKLCEIATSIGATPEKHNIYTQSLKHYLSLCVEEYLCMYSIKPNSSNKPWIIFSDNPNMEHLFYAVDSWLYCLAKYKETDHLYAANKGTLWDIVNGAKVISKQINIMDSEYSNTMIYDIFPKTILKKLSKEDICINVSDYARFNKVFGSKRCELVSPINYFNNKPFSVVLSFSVKLKPYSKKRYMNLGINIRRYIYHDDVSNIYLRNDVNSLVKVSCFDSYYVIPYRYCKGKIRWDRRIKDLFEKTFGQILPDINSYLKNTNHYLEESDIRILSPLSINLSSDNYMLGGAKTGVPYIDRKCIFESVSELIKEYAIPVKPCKRATPKRSKSTNVNNGVINYDRLRSAVGGRDVRLAVFSSSAHKKLATKIVESIRNHVDADLQVELFDNCDSWIKPMEENKSDNVQRYNNIISSVKQAECPTGAIFILPNKEYYLSKKGGKNNTDPKKTIRAALAYRGVLTQFIVPDINNQENKTESEIEDKEHAINAAIKDMLRQLGYIPYAEKAKVCEQDNYGIEVVSFEVDINKKKSKKIYVPVLISYNLRDGKVLVKSPVFDKELLYWEALLKLSKMSYGGKINNQHNIKHWVEIFIRNISNTHVDKECIVAISGTGILNKFDTVKWICDGHLVKHETPSSIIVPSIDFNKNIRIVRVRAGGESNHVPLYFPSIESDQKMSSISGIFKDGFLWYGLTTRPNKWPYVNAIKTSKYDNPQKLINTKNIIEYCPINIEDKNEALEVVDICNKLRCNMVQFQSDATNWPAPIHFIKKMKEYAYTSCE